MYEYYSALFNGINKVMNSERTTAGARPVPRQIQLDN